MKQNEMDYAMKHSMDDVKGFKKPKKTAKIGYYFLIESFVFVFLICNLLWFLDLKFLASKNQYLIGAGVTFICLGIIGYVNIIAERWKSKSTKSNRRYTK